MSGEKKYIHRDKIKPLPVPQYKGLTMKIFWDAIDQSPGMIVYFPDPADRAKTPRDWVCSMMNSIEGSDFKENVNKILTGRKATIVLKKKLEVKALPEFQKAIESTDLIE